MQAHVVFIADAANVLELPIVFLDLGIEETKVLIIALVVPKHGLILTPCDGTTVGWPSLPCVNSDFHSQARLTYG